MKTLRIWTWREGKAFNLMLCWGALCGFRWHIWRRLAVTWLWEGR